MDESGRGSWAGPVVAAAVVLDPAYRIRFIDDCKRVPAPRRRVLVQRIMEHSRAYAYGIVEVDVINTDGVGKAGLLAMQQALTGLGVVTPDWVFSDAFLVPGWPQDRQTALIRGDQKVVSIAAASILAKVLRDELMDQLHAEYPQYRFDLHRGYGTALHQKLLKQHGPSPIHRTSFTPIQDLLRKQRMTS